MRGFVGFEGKSKPNNKNATDMDRKTFAGLPGVRTDQMPDWHRDAIERMLRGEDPALPTETESREDTLPPTQNPFNPTEPPGDF